MIQQVRQSVDHVMELVKKWKPIMYRIFAGARYYPGGGYEDYKGKESSVEDALRFLAKINTYDWYQIVDEDDMIVESGECHGLP